MDLLFFFLKINKNQLINKCGSLSTGKTYNTLSDKVKKIETNWLVIEQIDLELGAPNYNQKWINGLNLHFWSLNQK